MRPPLACSPTSRHSWVESAGYLRVPFAAARCRANRTETRVRLRFSDLSMCRRGASDAGLVHASPTATKLTTNERTFSVLRGRIPRSLPRKNSPSCPALRGAPSPYPCGPPPRQQEAWFLAQGASSLASRPPLLHEGRVAARAQAGFVLACSLIDGMHDALGYASSNAERIASGEQSSDEATSAGVA